MGFSTNPKKDAELDSRQALAAFLAACFQDIAAVFGFRTNEESVGGSALFLLWLVCLRHNLVLYTIFPEKSSAPRLTFFTLINEVYSLKNALHYDNVVMTQ